MAIRVDNSTQRTTTSVRSWQCVAKNGVRIRLCDAAQPLLASLSQAALRSVEEKSGRQYTFLFLEVDNSTGRKPFKFARCMFAAVTRDGQKIKADWESIQVPWELEKVTRGYFLDSEVPPQEKRVFVVAFPKRLDVSLVTRVEMSLLYGKMLVCE